MNEASHCFYDESPDDNQGMKMNVFYILNLPVVIYRDILYGWKCELYQYRLNYWKRT